MLEKSHTKQKIRLEYFDHNEDFARCFPTQECGIVHRVHLSDTSAGEWLILKLSLPFSYDGVVNKRLLVRSRWSGYKVGGRDPTSVFILLATDGETFDAQEEFSNLKHVAWGVVYPINAHESKSI